jgi:hypothetical protein
MEGLSSKQRARGNELFAPAVLSWVRRRGATSRRPAGHSFRPGLGTDGGSRSWRWRRRSLVAGGPRARARPRQRRARARAQQVPRPFGLVGCRGGEGETCPRRSGPRLAWVRLLLLPPSPALSLRVPARELPACRSTPARQGKQQASPRRHPRPSSSHRSPILCHDRHPASTSQPKAATPQLDERARASQQPPSQASLGPDLVRLLCRLRPHHPASIPPSSRTDVRPTAFLAHQVSTRVQSR